DIGDIQNYDPVTGAPASPYVGQVVTVEGAIYIEKGRFNGGTHYIQDATGGIQFFDSGAPPLVLGDVVQVTGVVGSFNGIELDIAPTNIVYMSSGPEVNPIEVAIGALISDYEWIGNYVYTVGEVSEVGSNNFTIFDGADSVYVYIDSDTQITIGAVAVGDIYGVKSPCTVYDGIQLKPGYQGCVIENPAGDTAPVISNVAPLSWVGEAADPIVVAANIVDDIGVTSAMLYYRDDAGDSTGVFISVAMSNVSGDSWQGTIPGGMTGRQVDFYVEASDIGQTVASPGDAPAGWYETAVGFTSIYDCQFADPNLEYQGSSLRDKVVSVRGIVTAGTGDVGSNSKFNLQDGTGPFSGILVYEGTATNYVLPGDQVAIGGYIDEYYGLTEMIPHNGGAVYIESFGNDLPAPSIVDTRVLADNTLLDGNGILGEAYESVWIKTASSTVLDTLGYGEWIISDTGARADSVVVDPIIALSYQPVIGELVTVEGFMNYSYGDFVIVPISDAGIVTGESAVHEIPMPAGGFRGIAPNPFNPKTEISFVLTHDNLAQLNVYNMRGEFVKSLVNGPLATGDYVMQWDGTNHEGQGVSSGTYFARLRIGTEVLQVRKMSLVK
ncbi:T9SS type A sorting domain-containing protein, partial [bacterium]|nr:T9SS type A sorting domain-containing protein [bacterium]